MEAPSPSYQRPSRQSKTGVKADEGYGEEEGLFIEAEVLSRDEYNERLSRGQIYVEEDFSQGINELGEPTLYAAASFGDED